MASRRARAAIALAFLTLAICAGAWATVVQPRGLRVTVLSQIQPSKLPRSEPAPIAVFISGHIATPSGETPPQLQTMRVEVNRHGLLRATGLTSCRLPEVQPGSSGRALARCGDALVGSGRFWASIVLPDQRPYATRGRLLVFNGRRAGRRVLFAHIYTRKPFASSFVVTFAIRHLNGAFGTELTASLPQALGTWGFVDRIKLTLRRRYRYRGAQRSFFNAACPAPAGTRIASFPLALATFSFPGGRTARAKVMKTCRVDPLAD